LSLAYLPSQSPSGGIQGAVGPAQILYSPNHLRDTATYRCAREWGWRVSGQANSSASPTQEQPIASAGTRPLGFASLSYAPRKKLSVDLTAGRAAITYTPTAVRLGVMEDRFPWD